MFRPAMIPQMEDPGRMYSENPCADLVAAVVERARKDIRGEKGQRATPLQQRLARAWVLSKDIGPGSYLWYAGLMGLPQDVAGELAVREFGS